MIDLSGLASDRGRVVSCSGLCSLGEMAPAPIAASARAVPAGPSPPAE